MNGRIGIEIRSSETDSLKNLLGELSEEEKVELSLKLKSASNDEELADAVAESKFAKLLSKLPEGIKTLGGLASIGKFLIDVI